MSGIAIYSAVNAVSLDLSRDGISKTRQSQGGGNFKFRGIDEVMNALAPLLVQHKLIIVPRILERECAERTMKSGTVMFYVTVAAEFDFISAEDGSKFTARTYGEAMDSGDKATNKAMAIAYKYAAFQTFCIPTEGSGDTDPDALVHEPVVKDYKHLHKDGAHPWRGQPLAAPAQELVINQQSASQPAALPAAVSLPQPKKEETARASNPVDVRTPDPSAAARPAAQSRAAAIPTVRPTQSRAAAAAEKPRSAERSENLIKGLKARKREAQNAKTIMAIRSVARDHEAWKMTAKVAWSELTGLDQRRVKAEQEVLEITIRDTFAFFEKPEMERHDPKTGELPMAAE